MSKKSAIVVTGDRPTGRLHLGHYVGSVLNRLSLQETHMLYYMIADMQALTDHADDPLAIRNSVFELALDNLACGVDPAKATLFIQSAIPEIAEIALYFLNLVTLARLERNPTVKNEMREKGYDADVPAGFLIYPVSQAADILAFRGTVVPVGEDQLPVLEQVNEIVHKFNGLYGDLFAKITPHLSSSPRLMGLDGKRKMSKSHGNAIYLSDAEEIVEEKVMSMYTDPLHLHPEDAGHLEGNTVFEYLTAFDTDVVGLAELKKEYVAGGIGDVMVKKRLVGVLNTTLAPIRERREYLGKKPDYVMGLLRQGTEKAREVASETLTLVRKAVHSNYF